MAVELTSLNRDVTIVGVLAVGPKLIAKLVHENSIASDNNASPPIVGAVTFHNGSAKPGFQHRNARLIYRPGAHAVALTWKAIG